MAVLAPMPSMSESTAVMVNEGVLRKERTEKRKSYMKSVNHQRSQMSRTSSCIFTMPLNSSIARLRASRAGNPEFFKVGNSAVEMILQLAIQVAIHLLATEPVHELPHEPLPSLKMS